MRAYTAKGDQEKVMSPMNNGLIGFVNLFTENRPSETRRIDCSYIGPLF